MFNERICLGLPSLAGYKLPVAIEKVRALGFQSLMILPDGPNTYHSLGEFPTVSFYEGNEQQLQKEKEALSNFKHLSIHQAWDDEWKKWIDCATYFGAEIVTIHACKTHFLPQIVDYIKGKNIKIGIENEGGKYTDYLDLIKTTDYPGVGATIDTGHCAYFSEVQEISNPEQRVKELNETILKLARELGDKVYHFHFHNVRREDFRDHRSIVQGIINFAQLFSTLGEIGYQGLLDLELDFLIGLEVVIDGYGYVDLVVLSESDGEIDVDEEVLEDADAGGGRAELAGDR